MVIGEYPVSYPELHVFDIDWLQASSALRRSLCEREAFRAPDKALVPPSLVCQCEAATAHGLAEVGTQVEYRRHGRVGHDGCAVTVASDGDRARWTVQEVDL